MHRLVLFVALTFGLLAAIAGPPRAPASAAEDELSISFSQVDCDAVAVQVAYVDIQEQGGPTDKVLSVFVDADGDGVYPALPTDVVLLPDTLASESNPAAWSAQLPNGANVKARLRLDAEGPGLGELLDEDILETPDADCTGSITVDVTVPGIDTTDFSIDFDPGADFTLDDNDAPVVRDGLTPGLYVVTQAAEPGYKLVDIDCDGGGDVDIDVASREVVIHLKAGEDVVCVFENEKLLPTPTPTLVPPTATPAPATPVPASQPVAPAQNIIVNPPNVTVNVPAAQAPAAPVAPTLTTQQGLIRPPSTGDAGLLPDDPDQPWGGLVFGAIGAIGLAFVCAVAAKKLRRD